VELVFTTTRIGRLYDRKEIEGVWKKYIFRRFRKCTLRLPSLRVIQQRWTQHTACAGKIIIHVFRRKSRRKDIEITVFKCTSMEQAEDAEWINVVQDIGSSCRMSISVLH